MSLRVGILTVSDRVAAGVMEDLGGDAVAEALAGVDATIDLQAVVPDERDQIADILRAWCDEGLDVILTTGGTGLGPRDVTPDATLDVCDRQVAGIAEALRAAGMAQTPNAMLSRAVAATRGRTLIVNLPGSPSGAVEGTRMLAPLLPHAVAIMVGGKH